MEKCQMCGAPVEKKEYYAWTGWTVEDVLTLAESDDITISKDEALELLETHGESIIIAMIQEGWTVIQHFLQEFSEKGDK